MIPALALLLVLQGAPPEVTASVDRVRLGMGEELMLTVRARTRTGESVSLVFPPLSGFSVVGSRELTEVSVAGAGGPLRTTVRELQLRAEQAGALVIGPIRARQGPVVVSTDPIAIAVDSARAGVAARLSPLARALIDGAPPPPPRPGRGDPVALTVIVPADTVLAGQQLDFIVAAWFPRELRTRLRRLPVVTVPTPEGVWSYPQAAPTGIAATRLVRGRWMDLFVAHRVVFPLAPGRVVIPPATVEYAVPVTFSFFSREDRYSLQSDSVPITVLSPRPLAPPSAGLVPDDRRVVGEALSLEVLVQPAETRVGEPIEITATLTGFGNVALWPEPVFRWPPGFRAYRAETAVRLEPRDGRIGGSKTFRFLVVPDSAGTFLLPDVRYPYYDLAAGAHAAVWAAPRTFVVAPGGEPRAARALPPLRRGAGARSGWADRMARRLVPWGWAVLLAIPPLLAWAVSRRTRGPSRLVVTPPVPSAALLPMTPLGRLEREFLGVLASHVPDALARDGDGLAQALRAAGIESAVADHVMRLRDRLRAVRYGPRGVGDAAELAAEVEQVLRVLGAEPLGGRRRRVFVSLVLALCLAPRDGGAAVAQAPSAETLYEAGALRVAADSFAARAARQPGVAAHWYNLGATLYRAGADGKAQAAWTKAARLAPRDPLIRRARRLLPPPDAASESLLAVGPATPGEWALVAGAGWLALWAAVLARRRRAALVALAVLTAGGVALTALEWRRRALPLAVVVNPATPVRVAPYGGASAAASLDAGAALIVERSYGGGRWLEVRRRDGVRGWVLAVEVVRL